MSRITEKRGALGSWSVKFKTETPKTIRDGLEFFDHVLITPTWVDPRTVKEAGVLAAAKYTGVLYVRDFEETNTVSGFGLAAWLGDSEDKGNNFETDVTIQATDDFQTAIETAYPEPRPLAIGTIHSPTSTSGHKITIRFGMSPRQALDKVSSAFGTEYRINPDFTIDFGTQSELYPTTDAPKATLVRKGAGHDPNLDSMPIRDAELKEDRKGYATRSIVVAEGVGPATAIASHDLDPGTTFVDPQGNTLIKKKIVSSSSTDSGFAPTQAQLQLARAAKLHREYRLNVEDMELRGRYEVGDTIFLYDPDSRAVDTTNPQRFRGRVIYPVSIRLEGQEGPITKKNGVYHRKADGTIVDITEYIDFADGSIELQVGAFARKLVDINEQVGPRLSSDPLVPNTPEITSNSSLAYVDNNGERRARITITWDTPTNEDGSAVVDGSHYSIRLRKDGDTAWDRRSVDWGENELEVNDLSVGLDYEFQIRAVDSANPPNRSDWSATTTVTANQDTTPPDTPAAPLVSGRPQQVQVKHELGLASGGTFNLPDDLEWLRVYGDTSDDFTPGPGNYLGRIGANKTHLRNAIPVLGEFQITTTAEMWFKVKAVDKSGNQSIPSGASPVTAELWENANIGSLNVGKLTAGTITASVKILGPEIIGGRMATADTGPRVELQDTNVDSIFFWTDDPDEANTPGQMNSQIVGSGSSRALLLAMRSPDVVGKELQNARFFARSPEVGTGVGARSEAQVTDSVGDVRGWLDIQVGEARLAGGIAGKPSYYGEVVLQDTSKITGGLAHLAVMDISGVRTGFVALKNDIVIAGLEGNRRIQVTPTRIEMVDDSDGLVAAFTNTETDFFKNVNMNGWDILGASDITGSQVTVNSDGQTQLSSGGSTKFWVDNSGGGGNSTDIVAFIPAAGGFRRLNVGVADSQAVGRRAVWFPN